MMYRSGWGTKDGQEAVLAITIPRVLFDDILAAAVPSSFAPALYADRDAWQRAVAASEVRLQWDPEHGPGGEPLARRAIQLGLRGSMLKRYGSDEIVSVVDVSAFVAVQRRVAATDLPSLLTPAEDVYEPASEQARAQIGLDRWPPGDS
jgi:hypothetical protein